VVFCGWTGTGLPGYDGAQPPQEVDGPDARSYIQALERQPTTAQNCRIDPGPDGTYLVIVVGDGQRTTLFGGRKPCFHLTNGRRTIQQADPYQVPQPGQ
jgi:hypothetical protein